MKHKLFTEEQIIGLKEAETGLLGMELARKQRISEQTLYL
jgi:hypothetical protein